MTTTPTPLRVRATALGFYGGQRIREGVTFTIDSDKDFSEKWMERVSLDVPDQVAEKMSPRSPNGTARARRSADLTMSPAKSSKDAPAPKPHTRRDEVI